MITTDFKKELYNGLAARGYNSLLSAANSIGVSQQHFRSTMLGCPIVRPAALKMLEAIGYDVEVKLVRRLSPDEYMTSEQTSRIAHRLAQITTGNNPDTIYRIRMGTVKYRKFRGSYAGKFRVSGKQILMRYADEDPTFENIPVHDTIKQEPDAISLFNDIKEKFESSGVAMKTDVPKIYKVNTTILLLEKCELDKDGNIFSSEIIRKYASPCLAPDGDTSK